MKLIFVFLFTLFSCFASEISLTPEEKAFIKSHPTIKVSNELDWAPYDYNDHDIAKGYSVEYMKLLSKKTGLKFVYVADTWNHLLKKIREKEIDVIHVASKSKYRETFLNFTSSYLNYEHSLVLEKDNDSIKAFKDLYGKKVALGKNWALTKHIKEHHKQIIILEFNTSKEILQAVSQGTANAAIEENLTAKYFIRLYKLNNLKVMASVDIPNHTDRLHIGVRKDWPILRDILQKAIYSLDKKDLSPLYQRWLKKETHWF